MLMPEAILIWVAYIATGDQSDVQATDATEGHVWFYSLTVSQSVLIFVAHATTKGHMDACSLCYSRKPC